MQHWKTLFIDLEAPYELPPASTGQSSEPLQILSAGRTEPPERIGLGSESCLPQVFESHIGFAIPLHYVPDYLFRCMHDIILGDQPYAACQRVQTYQLVKIEDVLSHRIGMKASRFRNEVGVQFLSLCDFTVDQIPPRNSPLQDVIAENRESELGSYQQPSTEV
jgi:hypothetical protein